MWQMRERRDPKEICSQFVFGPESLYVDVALKDTEESGKYQRVLPPLCTGDLIFYISISGTASHVAKVNAAGLVVSKFEGKDEVYEHDLEGDPIPNSIDYEMCIIFRALR